MSRLARLRARRQTLLRRSAEQRAEIAGAVGALRSTRAAPAIGVASRAARNPLAWLGVLAGLTLLGRTRRVVSLLLLVGSAVSLASRATRLLKLLSAWRTAPAAGASAAGASAARERH